MSEIKMVDVSDDRKPKVSPLQANYEAIFSSIAGQSVLEDILAQCGVVSINIETNPIKMAFNEGRRAIGLYILQQRGFIAWNTLQGASRKKK